MQILKTAIAAVAAATIASSAEAATLSAELPGNYLATITFDAPTSWTLHHYERINSNYYWEFPNIGHWGGSDIEIDRYIEFENVTVFTYAFRVDQNRIYAENPYGPQPYWENVDYSAYVEIWGVPFSTFDLKFLSAVPEPTTWAMMIVGFGLAGGALRRRAAQGFLPATT